MLKSKSVTPPATKSKRLAPAKAASPPVPMLDLARHHAPLREEILQAITRICDSQHFILGSEVEKFESEMTAFLKAGEAVGCASGTDALWLALAAAGVQPGDSVITTPFSFFATASSIVRAGARPVFADIEEKTLNLDPAKVAVRARTTAKLSAVMPVHLYGQCANMDSFAELAAEFKVAIVEDAAQAIGAEWNGKKAGTMGASAAFSFYPTKNLSAFGDAGCATAANATVAAHMRSLRNHGSTRRYYHDEIGWNTRLDGIQAAVLRVKLKHIARWNQQRRERAAFYGELLKRSGLLGSSGKLKLLAERNEANHVFHQYVVRAEERDELRVFLTERGIGSEIYYPVPLHLQRCFISLGYREGDLPVSEQAARQVLALPMFAEITEEEQKRVVEAIADFYS